MGFEPMTSSLPRMRSRPTELYQQQSQNGGTHGIRTRNLPRDKGMR